MLDGRISANGSPAFAEGGGGGSGGSVWVTAGTLTGAGTISANGGMGNGFGLTGGGGGGGGRIAIQYGMNLFFGSTVGSGWQRRRLGRRGHDLHQGQQPILGPGAGGQRRAVRDEHKLVWDRHG